MKQFSSIPCRVVRDPLRRGDVPRLSIGRCSLVRMGRLVVVCWMVAVVGECDDVEKEEERRRIVVLVAVE